MESEFIARLAVEAGQILTNQPGSPVVRFKVGTDIVTDADEESERFIREEIRRFYPGHGILGEEYGSSEAEAEWQWVVDPLDGTVNYSRGSSYYAVSIALAHRGQTLFGAVYRPATDELFFAERGAGATLNGHPIHVSGIRQVEESIVILDWSRRETRQANLARMERLFLATHKARSFGSASLDLCGVACGQLDAFAHPGLASWDFAAGQLIVAEAGGRVTTLEGAERTLEAGSLLATNGLIHEETLSLLNP